MDYPGPDGSPSRRARHLFPTVKIVRVQSPDGSAHLGELLPDSRIRRLNGDLFGQLTPTEEWLEGRLMAPLDPPVIYCIGLNYRRHAEETGARLREFPVLFMKAPSAVIAPGDAIEIPTGLPSHQVDYECELAVVIGRQAKNVPRDKALDYVLGYTCANDVSARDWQKDFGGSQWCRGKTFDTFCPLGPAIVTPDEIPNPNALRISTIVNGEVLQDWNTDDMVFPVADLISFLSGSTTLRPGTLILTGTPHGVGMARTPPRWLQPGDTTIVEIEKIGRLENPVILEPQAACLACS
ncbi:MAG: fumarylacetoacetate hydrolase family protein [Terrimicrobiaceae bacterium]